MSNESLESYPFEWKSDPGRMEKMIRWSIFIITGVCAGLPAFVWSVRDIIHHRKNGHRISIFIILLLLTDFLELFLSPYVLIKLLLNEFCSTLDWTCWVCWALWWAMSDCGLLLNQLVALEEILSVKYPRFTASVFSSLHFQIFHTLVFICVIIGEFFWEKVDHWVTLLIIIVSVIPWLISCGASCSPDHHPHTSRKSNPHILVVFIVTLLAFYLPYICFILLFEVLQISRSIYFQFPVYVINLRLISDPLLCVLVCRQNLSVQTSQKPDETSSV